MSITHKEITAWISLAITLVVYGYYFSQAPHTQTAADMTWLFIGAVVAVVVLQIVLQVIASILHRPEKTDERDRAIETKAYRIAYYVMAAGVTLMVLQHLGFIPQVILPADLPLQARAVHALVLTLAAAEVIRCATIVFFYRREA